MAKVSYDFTRTIYRSVITAATVTIKDGNLEVGETVTLMFEGKAPMSEVNALKLLKKHHPDKKLTVVDISEESEVRGMTWDTFLINSEVVERPASQRKENK